MIFDDLYIFREQRFSVGIERESGRYYLSFPVSNGLVDYEEHHYLQEAQVTDILRGLEAAKVIAAEMKSQKDDANLIIKPGSARGKP